jgi:hypothetical protein
VNYVNVGRWCTLSAVRIKGLVLYADTIIYERYIRQILQVGQQTSHYDLAAVSLLLQMTEDKRW